MAENTGVAVIEIFRRIRKGCGGQKGVRKDQRGSKRREMSISDHAQCMDTVSPFLGKLLPSPGERD
jgi:hypothetical protein